MERPRILIVEDDGEWQEIYRRCLSEMDYDITSARKLSTAFALLEEQPFDVVITDLKMLGGNEAFSGFGVLEQAKALNPDVQVIVITGYGSIEHAMRSMGSGAYDYITKDLDLRKKLPLSVQGALGVRLLKQELLEGRPKDDVELEADRIIGNSASMQKLFDHISQVAESDFNVLIYGEAGTGRRLVAQTIHRQSRRRRGPFLVVDCSRLSEEGFDGELFGYEEKIDRENEMVQPGKFEYAKGGTIFLEGVGDLDLRLQRRLLNAVADRAIERVGGRKLVPIDVRIIASTDRDLNEMIAKGQFHRHLFDALNEFSISVPPLCDRKDGDDILALAALFLQRHNEGRPIQFSPEAVTLLRNYDYPGNVRELESVVKNAIAMTRDRFIRPEHLRPEVRNYKPPEPSPQSPKEPQDPGHVNSLPSAGTATATPSKHEPHSGYAVIIGVGVDLPVTVQDATALADLLKDPNRCAFPSDQVHLLTETRATRTAVLSSLDALAQSIDPECTAIVYFSGHGLHVQSPGEPESFFLLPYGYNLNDLINTTISGIEFTAKLRAVRSKKLLVLLDCCHAGGIAQPKLPDVTLSKAPLPLQAEAVLSEGSGRVILASSRADEYSYTSKPYSQFTIALLESLAGAGASEKDGYARVLDVALHVGRMVPNRTEDKQHPILKVANLENNFALAYYAGGAKEPLPLSLIGGEQPLAIPVAADDELAEGYRKLLRTYRHNLLEIEMKMAEYIDQRSVPPDLLRARNEVLIRIAELEQKW